MSMSASARHARMRRPRRRSRDFWDTLVSTRPVGASEHHMSRIHPLLVWAMGLALAAGGSVILAAASDLDVRINQIQVIGTHNSYHAGLTPGVAKLLQATTPEAFAGLEYSHPNLTTQLDHGI